MRGNIPTVTVAALAAAAGVGCAHVFPPPARTVTSESPCDDRAKPEQWALSSISVLCAEDFEGMPVFQLEEWVEGRVPGVSVVRGARGISLLIRGRGSLLGNTEPLYVLDGVPLVMEPGRGLSWLSPGDIQMLEILKDAGATALYGVRGANGVVLITTRR